MVSQTWLRNHHCVHEWGTSRVVWAAAIHVYHDSFNEKKERVSIGSLQTQRLHSVVAPLFRSVTNEETTGTTPWRGLLLTVSDPPTLLTFPLQ